jgi:S1-C subfamily serine protease
MRGRFGWQWRRLALVARAWLAVLCTALTLGAARNARAQPLAAEQDSRLRVGFSNLVARLDSDEIGFAKAEYRVHILEALRAAGFNAVGAESLVFDRDEGQRADLILGGTVRELECRRVARRTNCRVAIQWELLDRDQDAVVYRVLARHMEPNVDRTNGPVAGRKLALGALRSLIARPRFAELLKTKRELPPDANYAPAAFRSCIAQERELPAQFNEAADATYLVKQAGGFGSGFSISPDGLILTAAHVVSGKTVELSRRGETATFTGTVVRVARKHDVALIVLAGAGADQPCLEVEPAPPSAGDDVYAIGSPASQDLAFSLTRGIVSGLRLQEGIQLVQTDASLSPGNSGGPLLDRHARVVGIVTKKLAGQAMEGLGFGVQIRDALQALKLEPQLTTAPSLLQPAAAAGKLPGARPIIVDADSPMPSLDPAGDRRRRAAADYARRLQERSDATAWYVKPMRWVGLAASLGGTLGIVYSTSAGNQERITRRDYQKYRTQNDISWAIFGLGTAAFAVSYPLEPGLAPARTEQAGRSPSWSVALGPGQIDLAMRLGL